MYQISLARSLARLLAGWLNPAPIAPSLAVLSLLRNCGPSLMFASYEFILARIVRRQG